MRWAVSLVLPVIAILEAAAMIVSCNGTDIPSAPVSVEEAASP